MKKIIICILLCFALTSCAAVPENVISDINERKNNIEMSKQFKVSNEFVKVENIFERNNKHIEYVSNLLKISADIAMPKAEKAYKMQMSTNEKYLDNFQELLEIAFGDKNLDYTTEEYDLFIRKKYNTPEIMSESASCGGFDVSIFDNINSNFSPMSLEEKPPIVIENFDEESLKNHKYNVWGGELEVSKMLETWNEYANFVKKNTTTLDFNLRTIYIYKSLIADEEYYLKTFGEKYIAALEKEGIELPQFSKEDIYNYFFVGNFSYKGINFDNNTEWGSSSSKYNSRKTVVDELDAFMNVEGTEQNRFHLTHSFEVSGILEEYDEILSLESAIKILSEKVSKNTKINIDDIELVYIIYYNGEPDIREQHPYKTGDFYAEPVWKFKDNTTINASPCFYVNAINGEILSFEKTTKYL